MNDIVLKITGDVADINRKLTDVNRNLGLLRDAAGTIPGVFQQVQTSFKRLGGEITAVGTNALAAVVSLGMLKKLFRGGAEDLKAESAFKAMADSAKVNAGELSETSKKAAAGFVADSHLMQKAAFAIAEDIDPAKIPQLFEAARVAARKTGEDVTTSIDGMIQAISTNTPKVLRQMGMVTKEQMTILNKAVALGIDDINLLDLVLANAAIDAAKLGESSDNAAKQLKRFQVQAEELGDVVGKGLIDGLQRLMGVFQGVAGFSLGAAAGIFKVLQASNELMAFGADKVGATETAAKWRAKGKYWNENAVAADQAAMDLYQKSIGNMYGGLESGDKRSADERAADIAKAEARLQKIIDALKKRIAAAKLANSNLPDEWAKEWRALSADIAKERDGIEEWEKKLLDIDKRAGDLKSKFKDIPEAAEKIDSWAKQAKLFAIDESGKKDFDERRKVYIEGLKDQRELDSQLTQSKASELEKRTLQVDEAAKKQRALALSALNAEAIDFDTYNKKMLQIEEESTRQKIKLRDEFNKASREAEINSQIAELDLAEKLGRAHADTLSERIRLQEELRKSQELSLAGIDREKDPAGWYAQMAAIQGTQKAIADLSREIAMQNPFSAISLGLKDVGNEAREIGKQLYDAVNKAFSGMTDSLTDFVMTGKANFADLANSIIRDMIRIQIQQQVTTLLAASAGGWLASFLNPGQGGVSGGMAIAGGYKGGSYAGYHSGGVPGQDPPTFYRIVPAVTFAKAPRFHDGIGPGERPAIIRDDEGVFTPGQMKALGLGRTPQSIRIEVLDRSGAKVTASSPEVRFDAQEMVVSFWIDALQNNKFGLRSMLGR